MKQLKNNKGSTLALVIIMIGVLSILGTSVLGAAVSNLKMKKTNTIAKTNMYLAEAGLEETYAKIYKIVGDGINEANKKADELLKSDSYNEAAFQKAVTLIENGKIDEAKDMPIYDIIKTLDGEYIYNESAINELREAKFKEIYLDYIEEKIDGLSSSESNLDPNIKVTVTAGVFEDKIGGDRVLDTLVVKLSSKVNKNSVTRISDVDLEICVPEYKESYSVVMETKNININPILTYCTSVGGPLNINYDTTIQGPIFMSQNNGNIKSNLNVNSEVTVNGEISSVGDILVNSDGNLSVNGSMFVSNVMLDADGANFKAIADSRTNDEDTEPKGLYVKDDLTMNGDGQTVKITGDYYGFSDGSNAQGNRSDQSSGIIINSTDLGKNNNGSKLSMKGKINLFGTSYITLNAKDGDDRNILYQTGESISVKGNYVAYTMPLANPKYGKDSVRFEYIDPLVLAVGPLAEPSNKYALENKNEYFYGYYEENSTGDLGGLNLSGIELRDEDGNPIGNDSDKYISLGNIINDNTVLKDNYKINDVEVFKIAENDHKCKTTAFGIEGLDGTHNIATEFKTDIATYKDINTKLDNTINVIINKDNDIGIVLNPSETYYGFIVTNGKVTIGGNGEFAGVIVAGEGIDVNGNTKLTYDEKVVLSTLAADKDDEGNDIDIGTYFVKNELYENKKFSTSSIEDIENDLEDNENFAVNVDYSSLLKFNNWKINYHEK